MPILLLSYINNVHAHEYEDEHNYHFFDDYFTLVCTLKHFLLFLRIELYI